MSSRIKDLNELSIVDIRDLKETISFAMDDDTLTDAEKAPWKTLLRTTRVSDNSIDYIAVTPKGFYESVATDTLKGIVKVLSTVITAGTNEDDAITQKAFWDSISTESLRGVIQLASQVNAEGFTDNVNALTSLRGSQLVDNKFGSWVNVAYNPTNYINWSGSGTNFKARYSKVGKTVTLNMHLEGVAPGSTSSIAYILPGGISNLATDVSVSVIAKTSSGYKAIAGAYISGGFLFFENTVNFVLATWIFKVSGTWEIN